MARYQVTLAYDGTHYQGFQRQARGNTIQQALEAALMAIGWQGKSILAAGRTDAGVHASGQVVAFDLDWQHGTGALRSALNANLPPEIAVQDVAAAAAGFHPRYDATARHYQYRLLAAPVRDPLRERFAWRVWPAADLAVLQAAAALLLGEHDFAAFGSPPVAGGPTRRVIFRSEWRQSGAALTYDIVGNAFLYRMVRRLVAFQVAIAQGKERLERLQENLQQPGDTSAAGAASASGLCLKAVYFDGSPGQELPWQMEIPDLNEKGQDVESKSAKDVLPKTG